MAAVVHGRIILLFILAPAIHFVIADECKLGSYDLTALHAFSPWDAVSDFINATFKINLCAKLSQDDHHCPDGTSVCAEYPNGTSISFGNYSDSPSVDDHDTGGNGDLLVHLQGQPNPTVPGTFYSTVIYFKCGKTLGHPRSFGLIGVSVHFEWESYVFCKDLPVPVKEVPCSVVKNGHVIDLSPLTKLTGSHLVDEDKEHDRRIYINVCRDIKPGTNDDSPAKHCPSGSAACRVIGNDGVNFGMASRRLEATNDGVKMVYTATEKPDTCVDEPTTTINFRCPERGGSKDPNLLTDFLVTCDIEIDWVTEYACPVDQISSKTCQLTKEEHDIDIDLTPLKNPKDFSTPYVVNVTDGSDHYMYFINVCSSLGFGCGENETATASVCQRKAGDSSFQRNAGESQFMELRYSDHDLTMTMRDGDTCHTNYRRKTVIDFVCNQTAVDNGRGYPVYIAHSDCDYYFQWGTKYACIDHPVDDTCRVDVDGKRFDLSSLVKEEGSNWEVIAGDGENDDLTYFLNVCHDVLNDGEASSCPPGAAFCSKGANGAKSLGRYTQSLKYDKASKSLILNYTENTPTDNGCKPYTTVNFFCSTGDFDSAPRLVYKSIDGCYHEIEWHTAAACVLSHKTGEDCRVYDDDAGYVFDLNPLKLEKGHVVGSSEYNYIINVCAPIKDDHYCNAAPHDNAAVCQVKRVTPGEGVKVGEPATKLGYFDGVLNLTYTNGEPYNNPEHTHRMSEIAFVCDMAAGMGKPEFLDEKNFTYAFQWRTSYACPVAPVECVVTNEETHEQYDLSSLSKMSQNWEIENREDPQNKIKFYINVCRPLGPVKGAKCSPFASACALSIDGNGKETLYHGNLGRSETAPTITSSIHGVSLVYTNGDSCTDENGKSTKFKTTVNFVCIQGKLAGGPSQVRLTRPCEYTILWETEAACPINDVKTEDQNKTSCSVRDPNSEFIFNLMPLSKPEGYEVKSSDGSKTYKVNICGPLQDSVCGKFESTHPASICEIGSDSNTAIALLEKDLTYSSQQLSLKYSGHFNTKTGVQSEFIFNFFCDSTAQQAHITYDGVTFKVRTALACPPRPVSCMTEDSQGNQYDLTPLGKESDNWVVVDPNHSDVRYHINVCRPVNPSSDFSCPGGAVGGCQTTARKDGDYNMGYVQSKPVVSSNGGEVTLHYEGGDICHEGKVNESHRSTRINFFCDTVEHGPVFDTESPTCEYSFDWRTPSACPQKLTKGSNCKVTDPLYNFEFDLSSLRKSSEDYKISGNGYEFYLNVCGPLKSPPSECGTGDLGGCQVGAPSGPIQTGMFNDQLIYNSGQLSLVYTDGKGNCHGQYNRSTVITFVCDHSKSGEEGPNSVNEGPDCTYLFEWPTRAACPPHQIVDCTYRYGDKTFDLSRLSLTDSNYEREYEDSNKLYILNVCRSLVHKKGQTCPFDAAACEIDLSEKDPKKKYHNIGEVTSHMISYEHDTLTLRYDNGELCNNGKTRRSTVIVFQCDQNSDALGTPSSHLSIGECVDHFIWTSSAACPLSKQTDEDSVTDGFGDCKVTNPNTGYEFDLSSLKKAEGYTTYDRDGHEFNINICGWLDSSSRCHNGTGSCQVEQDGDRKTFNAGDANARLLYRDGVLSLKYTGGDECSDGKVPRTTIFNFVCVPGMGKGVPVYVDKSGDCVYYFDWQTDLACEREVKCEVDTDTGSTLDFSPLIMKSGHYNVLPGDAGSQDPKGMIYINLCRPLNPIFGTLCPSGSGACLVQDNKKPLSLGRIDEGPVYDSSHKLVKLTYINGDPCPDNPQKNMTSHIMLKCGPDEFLDPKLEVVSDCQYIFMWETPLACSGKTTQKLNASCTFYDSITKEMYDLSHLSDEYKVPSEHGGTYHIRPCGQLQEKGDRGDSSCSQSSVCLTGSKGRDGSYGDPDHAMFEKESGFVDLKFSQGRKCPSGQGKAVSAIYFHCDRAAGLGTPQVQEDGDCEATFRWNTDLVCPKDRKECLTSSKGTLFDFTFLSQETGSWNHTDADNNIYWLNLCQSVHGKAIAAGCPANAAVCRKTPDGKVQMLGQLDTQTVTTMGDRPSNTTIVVQYSEGDKDSCEIGRRRRSDRSPTVIIRLVCGNTVGAPVFLQHRPENAAKCIFEFTWKSRLACPVGYKHLKVAELNGQIADIRTQTTINLKPLLGSNKVIKDGNKKYLINLAGALDLDSSIRKSSACQGASVCQTTGDKIFRNLGSLSTKAYYIEDERLEVVFTSPQKCSGNQKDKNVTSTIMFNCKSGAAVISCYQKCFCLCKDFQEAIALMEAKYFFLPEDLFKFFGTQPELLYQSSDCAYVFNWDTSLVCFHITPSVIVSNNEDSNSASSNPSTPAKSNTTKIGIGISIVLTIAVICILVLVLYKPERRALIGSKLKRIVMCKKNTETPIVYSRLSQADEEGAAEEDDDPFNPFKEPDEESEINNSQLPPCVSTYHDDSDEDMLL